ncbi:MAG: hypothetical protein ACKOEY_02530, partial [Phenylobacterium sp.]
MTQTPVSQTRTLRPGDIHDYAVLRQSGTHPERARIELNLRPGQARRLEQVMRARATRGEGDRQLPKFAHHDRHVRAVMAQGGFWALSERRIGRDGVAVCLPLIPP